MQHHDSRAKWEFEQGPPCRSVHLLLVSRFNGRTFTMPRSCRSRRRCVECRRRMGRDDLEHARHVFGASVWIHHEMTEQPSSAVRQRRLRKHAEFLRVRTSAGVTHFCDRSIGGDKELPGPLALMLARELLPNDALNVWWSKFWRPAKRQPRFFAAAQTQDADLLDRAVEIAWRVATKRWGSSIDPAQGWLGVRWDDDKERERIAEWLRLLRFTVRQLRAEGRREDVAKNPRETSCYGFSATSRPEVR
jgi:hypothetical protein